MKSLNRIIVNNDIYSDLNFNGSTKLLGIRPFMKPFGQSSIPIVETMEIGASSVSDYDDYSIS